MLNSIQIQNFTIIMFSIANEWNILRILETEFHLDWLDLLACLKSVINIPPLGRIGLCHDLLL